MVTGGRHYVIRLSMILFFFCCCVPWTNCHNSDSSRRPAKMYKNIFKKNAWPIHIVLAKRASLTSVRQIQTHGTAFTYLLIRNVTVHANGSHPFSLSFHFVKRRHIPMQSTHNDTYKSIFFLLDKRTFCRNQEIYWWIGWDASKNALTCNSFSFN